MSDLQKSFMKKKFTPYHPSQAPVLEEREEDAPATTMNEGEDDSSDQSSTGTVVPSPTENLFAKPNLCAYTSRNKAFFFVLSCFLM